MSATNRGAVRRAMDYYPTPAWCVRRILEAVPLPRGRWVEPSAGDGSIVREIRAAADFVTALELRAECRGDLERSGADAVVIDDALAAPWPSADVVIANPPYALADAFAARAVEAAPHALFLLRLNWISARSRVEWLRTHRPDVWILPERPSFDGSGNTDATAYAWLHWHPGAAGSVSWVATTPAAERVAGAERQLRLAEVLP